MRGTKKFRVVVNPDVVTETESEPVYVTWDEWAIVADLSAALALAVEGHADYKREQKDLLECMRPPSGGATGAVPTFSDFNQILSQYSGDTKIKLDGPCRSDSDAMFSTVQSLSQTHLNTFKTSNSEYGAWLETPQGVSFAALAGNTARMKLHAYLKASDHTAFPPGQLEEPVYGDTDGVGGQQSPPNRTLTSGFGCLPSGVDGASLTLANKTRVLNCLVFSTPHDFWVAGEDGVRPADQLLEEDIPKNQKRWDWLGFEEWDCTKSPDGPLPSCLKHDVVFSSLQKFAGPTAGKSNGDELDAAWNPRNKALADAKFRADIEQYGCQDASQEALDSVCPLGNSLMARIYFWGVADNPLAHRGWPVTEQDLVHIDETPNYVVCGNLDPTANRPPVPRLDIASVHRPPNSGSTFETRFRVRSGCVDDITIDSYRVVWKISYEAIIHSSSCLPATNKCVRTYYETIESDYNRNSTPTSTVSFKDEVSSYRSFRLLSVDIIRIRVKPDHHAYGGRFYDRDLDHPVYRAQDP